MSESDATSEALRLDKWLWAARFFKTRQLAIDAVNAGRVTVNGGRAKPAKVLRAGDTVVVRKPPYEQTVTVLGIAAKRGSATLAQQLYEETAASRAARESLAAEMKSMPPPLFKGRPTKRDRRLIEKLGFDDSP